MLIELWTETLPNGWEWAPDNYLGGTPEFYIETASVLTQKGYEVVVYYDGSATELNSVYYLPRNQFQGSDIVISCNERPPSMGKTNLYWTNKVDQKATAFQDFDHIVAISKWQADNLLGWEKVTVIPHACWPEQFQGGKKEKGLCIYTSSPDRGGEFLKGIKGIDIVHTYQKGISEQEMIDLYKRAQFWLHPGQGVELFCISGYKAMAAGCIPVYVPNMALSETIQYGVKTTLEEFERSLRQAIENPPPVPNIHLKDWEEVTNELERLWK
jgi:glycosyltransferase involved in cell wall biosynthesis